MAPELPVGEPVDGIDAQPPSRGPLEGRFVALEPLEPPRHAEPLWRAAHDGTPEAKRLWTYMPYGPFASVPEIRSWLEGVAGSTDPMFFTVLAGEERVPIGMASYLNVDTSMRHIELGHIWFAPRAQRSEANTETAYLMMREAFERLGYRRVEWKCDALNARSRAAAVRLGFTFEGVFRRHMIVKSRNRDTAWFSVIEAEWPGVRSALERWLASEPGARPSLASLREAEG
jgi:RimJ/RimL family protein N-acetyltransferase